MSSFIFYAKNINPFLATDNFFGNLQPYLLPPKYLQKCPSKCIASRCRNALKSPMFLGEGRHCVYVFKGLSCSLFLSIRELNDESGDKTKPTCLYDGVLFSFGSKGTKSATFLAGPPLADDGEGGLFYYLLQIQLKIHCDLEVILEIIAFYSSVINSWVGWFY